MPRLILDCDTKNEIDDQFAIAYALASGATVEAVVDAQNTNVSGPDSVLIYQEETRQILEASGRSDVPNLRGVERPLEAADRPGRAPGVEFIIESARRPSPEPLFVVGTGPATDLASAILLAPDIADRATFVWLGAHRGAEEHAKFGEECNFIGDRWAAKALFEAPVPLIHVPAMGVTNHLLWKTRQLVERLMAVGRPVHRLLAARVAEYMARTRRDVVEPEKEFWDIGAVDVVLGPERHTIADEPAFGFDAEGKLVIPGRGTRTVRRVIGLDATGVLDAAWRVIARL